MQIIEDGYGGNNDPYEKAIVKPIRRKRKTSMKVNEWSVVQAPQGVSLKPIKGYGEVCISIENGFISVAVYPEILNDPDPRFADHALSELRVPMALLNNEGGV